MWNSPGRVRLKLAEVGHGGELLTNGRWCQLRGGAQALRGFAQWAEVWAEVFWELVHW